MRIVFMGTPDFAVPSLEKLVEGGYRPVAVVTGADKPRGRGLQVQPTPVKAAAVRLGIDTILQPVTMRDPAFAEDLRRLHPDLFVVVAFRILPPEVFQIPTQGSFNLHGSLLPAYRGAAPINRAIMAGESRTGVTTFFLQEAVDTGNVILKREMEILPDDTAGDVHDRMMILGAEAVLDTVRLIERGAVQTTRQDDRLASPAPKIFNEDRRVDWSRPAAEVHNHVRGLSPYPAAWTQHGALLLKLYRTRLAEGSGEPGEVLGTDNGLTIACGTGAVEVLEIQQEGRKRLDATVFLRGFPLRRGDRLG